MRLFRDAAAATADWVMTEMQSPEGGYYSSLDADSEGEEGRFYVWDRAEVRPCWTPDEYALIAPCTAWTSRPTSRAAGTCTATARLESVAAERAWTRTQARRCSAAKAKLLAARGERVRPGPRREGPDQLERADDQGHGARRAGAGRPDLLASAERALDFIRAHLWRDGRLLATYKDGKAHLNAYLDDYALLLDALLELLADALAPGRPGLGGGAGGGAAGAVLRCRPGRLLLHRRRPRGPDQRPKPLGDEAMPSGNGVAAHAPCSGSAICSASTRYLDAARRRCASPPSPCAASPTPMPAC
jgi:uncharacterized protein YyaL (SSP411 family)